MGMYKTDLKNSDSDMKTAMVLPLILFCFALGNSQWQNNYEAKLYIDGTDTLRYRILYPNNFDSTKKYPLLLFLHGAGERGNDNESQLIHGAKLFATDYLKERHPAIVIFPQCPKEDYWSKVEVDRSSYPLKLNFDYEGGPTKALGLVMDLLDQSLAQSHINPDRVYLMGLSMGAMGSFELLARRPETFAAAIPICGGGDPESVGAYAKGIALWVIHGARDNVVDPLQSMEMVSALLGAGAHPRMSLYEFANHNSWDPAFAEPELLPWLFSHKRTKP